MCDTALSKGGRLNGTSERHIRGLSYMSLEVITRGWEGICFDIVTAIFCFILLAFFCLTSGGRTLSWTARMNNIFKGWWEGQVDSTVSALEGVPVSFGSCEISVTSKRLQPGLSGRNGPMCVSYNKPFASPQFSI